MYSIVENLLAIPTQYANSIVSYICGALVLLFCAVIIDMVYKFFRHIIKSIDGR